MWFEKLHDKVGYNWLWWILPVRFWKVAMTVKACCWMLSTCSCELRSKIGHDWPMKQDQDKTHLRSFKWFDIIPWTAVIVLKMYTVDLLALKLVGNFAHLELCSWSTWELSVHGHCRSKRDFFLRVVLCLGTPNSTTRTLRGLQILWMCDVDTRKNNPSFVIHLKLKPFYLSYYSW